jgi:hypothetical protein
MVSWSDEKDFLSKKKRILRKKNRRYAVCRLPSIGYHLPSIVYNPPPAVCHLLSAICYLLTAAAINHFYRAVSIVNSCK